MFCETRTLAEEWTYRFLAAALVELATDGVASQVPLPEAWVLASRPPTTAEVRAWAVQHGIAVSPRGKVSAEVRRAYDGALGEAQTA